MATPPLNPNQIPDDATGRDLAGFIGEDIARQLAVRGALIVAVVCAFCGFVTDAEPELRVAGSVVGLTGAFMLVVTVLMQARRSRQWWMVAVVLVTCGALLAAILVRANAT